MFGLFKKKNNDVSMLLDKVENIQRSMRRSGVFAPIKYMNDVFEKLDDPTLKLTRDQVESLEICLGEIEPRIHERYVDFIKYECEQILIRMDKSKILTEKDEVLGGIEQSIRIAEADLKFEKLKLEEIGRGGGSDMDELSVNRRIGELEAKIDSLRRDYEDRMREET